MSSDHPSEPQPAARGTLYVGTSGFAYPAWAPTFYPAGTRQADLLPAYAARLRSCELNTTFYRQPEPQHIERWLDATPDGFRFTVKANRAAVARLLRIGGESAATELTRHYRPFGSRLGAILLQIPDGFARDDEALDHALADWPRDLPIVVEARDASWLDDLVFDRLRIAGAAWCTTELDDHLDPPIVVRTGSLLYLRLRRSAYSAAELEAWAARLAPFLEDGMDVFVFFRHDETGISGLRAQQFAALTADLIG